MCAGVGVSGVSGVSGGWWGVEGGGGWTRMVKENTSFTLSLHPSQYLSKILRMDLIALDKELTFSFFLSFSSYSLISFICSFKTSSHITA